MIPGAPELTVMPWPLPLTVGSGKFGTPCWRMHCAWASAACLARATTARRVAGAVENFTSDADRVEPVPL